MPTQKCEKCGQNLPAKWSPLQVKQYVRDRLGDNHVIFLIQFNRDFSKKEEPLAMAEARRFILSITKDR